MMLADKSFHSDEQAQQLFAYDLHANFLS